jgi:hypothetical protein
MNYAISFNKRKDALKNLRNYRSGGRDIAVYHDDGLLMSQVEDIEVYKRMKQRITSEEIRHVHLLDPSQQARGRPEWTKHHKSYAARQTWAYLDLG